jgi:tripartite-type tricarboxylate transporter receptor subunit TctC
MKLRRRQFLHLAAGTAALPAISRIARAQTYPTRPVTLVVGASAGAAVDVLLRALAHSTEMHLGKPIVIDNRPGAGGTLAAAQTAAANPDGYTITNMLLAVFRAAFLRKTNYDPTTDFTYIINVAGYTFGAVVKQDARWQTFEDLLADAKANPGKIAFSTGGTGGGGHVVMEMIAKEQGIKWLHVPFKSSAEAVTAVLGGHVDVMGENSTWAPQVRDGQLRLLVTWGGHRSKGWPDVPTLRDLGIDLAWEAPIGVAGPRGIAPNIVRILHDAFKAGMEDPSFTAMLAKFDQESLYMSSRDYHDFAMRMIPREKQIVEELGLKQN